MFASKSPAPTSPHSKEISHNLSSESESYQQTEIEPNSDELEHKSDLDDAGTGTAMREAAFVSITLVVSIQVVFLIAGALFLRGTTFAGTTLSVFYIAFSLFVMAQTIYSPIEIKKYILFWHVSSFGRCLIFSFLSVVIMQSASFLIGGVALVLSLSLFAFHILFGVPVPQPLFHKRSVTHQFTLAAMYKSPPASAQNSPYYSLSSFSTTGNKT